MHLQLFKLTCKCVHLYLQRKMETEREKDEMQERIEREGVIQMKRD